MQPPEATAPLWVPEHDYLPPEDRSVIRALRSSQGIVTWGDFTVAVTEPNSWAIVVSPGRAIVDGTVSPWTQGTYICYAPDSRTVPVTPSDPSLDRFDIVVVHVHDQDNSTEVGYGWDREVIEGIPGSGQAPDPPPNSLVIAGIHIPAGSMAITNDSLYQWEGGLGGGFHFRTAVGQPYITQYSFPFNYTHQGASGGPVCENFAWYPSPYSHLMGWTFDAAHEIEIVMHISHDVPDAGLVSMAAFDFALFWNETGQVVDQFSHSAGYWEWQTVIYRYVFPTKPHERPGFRLSTWAYQGVTVKGFVNMKSYPRGSASWYLVESPL